MSPDNLPGSPGDESTFRRVDAIVLNELIDQIGRRNQRDGMGGHIVADSEDRRVALVTGASRGIGKYGALALARRGFDVVITARTVREGEGLAQPSSSKAPEGGTPIAGSLETTAAEIEALGRSCLVVPMDLMERASIHRVAEEVLDRWGRVDVLFNNAIYQGPGTMDRILDLPIELAERCLIGDYLHPLLLIQLLLPQMLARGEGRLVNMLSEAAFTTPPAPAGEGGWGVGYAAAKAAFHRVTDMCHVEFFDSGIWSFSIAPGLTLTESMRASGTDKVLTDAGYAPAPPEVAGEVAAWLGSAPEAEEFAGQMVSSRPLCKKLGLVPGWPPPR